MSAPEKKDRAYLASIVTARNAKTNGEQLKSDAETMEGKRGHLARLVTATNARRMTNGERSSSAKSAVLQHAVDRTNSGRRA